MWRHLNVIRHLLVVTTITGLAVGICVYANPYSLHRVTIVSYDEFDTPPDAKGVVMLQTQSLDFRLPVLSWDEAAVHELENLVNAADDKSTLSQIRVTCAFVRAHLNASDTSKPSAAGRNVQQLLSDGLELHCLCSDHSLLLNEALQSRGLTSRVVWLEGHVANEVFDEQNGQWIYVDAHQNLLTRDDANQPLSIARLIRRLERDEPVKFEIATVADVGRHVLQYTDQDTAQRLWYRNVLLNGECTTLSGSTLQSPSRWTHLMRHQTRPQKLVLRTAYDSSPDERIERFSPRKALLTALAMNAAFYLGGFLLFGRRRDASTQA